MEGFILDARLRDAIVDTSCLVIRLRQQVKECAAVDLPRVKTDLNNAIASMETLCLDHISRSREDGKIPEYPIGIDIFGDKALEKLALVQIENERLKRLESINDSYKKEVGKAFDFIAKESKRNDKISRDNKRLKKENDELRASMRCWIGGKAKC